MRILKVSQENLNKIAGIAARSIRQGKVIISPTDTVYGLIADATNKKAVEKIFKIKKRLKEKPLPIFVKDLKQAEELAKIDKGQEKFLNSSWPGKTTAVLIRKKTKIKLYGIDKETIALRIPRHNLINGLLKELNIPLTGTSANISGKPATTKIQEAINQFKNQKEQPDLIIDNGELTPSKPSTVLDFTGQRLKILRK